MLPRRASRSARMTKTGTPARATRPIMWPRNGAPIPIIANISAHNRNRGASSIGLPVPDGAGFVVQRRYALRILIIRPRNARAAITAARPDHDVGSGGSAYWLLGMLEIVKISGASTNGDYGLIEVTVRAREGSPWHVHPDEDEWFYVLAGEFTVYVGDERLSLPAGSFAFGPKGVPHTFIAETDGAKALIGFQPFLFEGFLNEVGESATERVLPPPLEAPPDMARLIPIGSRNGIEILGPPGPPPGH